MEHSRPRLCKRLPSHGRVVFRLLETPVKSGQRAELAEPIDGERHGLSRPATLC